MCGAWSPTSSMRCRGRRHDRAGRLQRGLRQLRAGVRPAAGRTPGRRALQQRRLRDRPRSNEFKALRVEMDAALHLLPPAIRRRAVLLSSNYALYGDMSKRVTQTLAEFSPPCGGLLHRRELRRRPGLRPRHPGGARPRPAPDRPSVDWHPGVGGPRPDPGAGLIRRKSNLV